MGVDLRAFEILERLDSAGKLRGARILTLGRQHIDYDHRIAHGYEWLDDFLFDQFEARCHSIDVSDYEDATFVWDFQEPIGPEEDFEPYDLILDFGTVEHIYDIARVYENIDQLLAPGGMYVGVNGRTGWNSHGLFQFTPEFSFTLANKLGYNLESWTVEYGTENPYWYHYITYGHDPQPVWRSLTKMTYLVVFMTKPSVVAGHTSLAKSVRYEEFLHASKEEAPTAVVADYKSSQFVIKPFNDRVVQ